MFSIVHVLLPMTDTSPAEAIRASLARYERGGRGEVPDEWLAWHDETAGVRELHEATFVFTRTAGGLRIEGGDHWLLDTSQVRQEMARRGVDRWSVRFADMDPSLDAFFDAQVRGLERHPVTGGFGQRLNALGRWDWWDLGGRFDGRITGDRRRPGMTASVVSSGDDPGRTLLANVTTALGATLGSDPAPELVVEADTNVEMVSRLLEDLDAGASHAIPGAVLLPPGLVEDRLRWLSSWPEIGPVDALSSLGLTFEAAWKDVVRVAYERHADHWAAGVAFHL